MAIHKILEYPNPKLRNKAKPVTEFNDDLAALIDDMFETLYDADNGVGLAATQIGVAQQVIVIDLKEGGKSNPLCLINTEILAKDGSVAYDEGCLSVPGAYEKIERAYKIKVRTFDKKGEAREFEAEDFFAVCIQHEMDHLNGVLFIDHLSAVKRDRVKRKLIQLSKRKL